MKRSAAAVAGLSLIGGLLVMAPTQAHAAACDPAHVIAGTGSSPEVAVGTVKSQTMKLIMATSNSCDVTEASVIVMSPRRVEKVTLHPADQATSPTGTVVWQGSTSIAPKSLQNSDAGAWTLVYLATGPDSQSTLGQAHVRRATRLSLDAGPEPVKTNQLRYTGRLERANWDKSRYAGYRQQLTISYEPRNADGPSNDPERVTQLTTTENGTYSYAEQYRGPGDYVAYFAGTSTSAETRSPFDRITP